MKSLKEKYLEDGPETEQSAAATEVYEEMFKDGETFLTEDSKAREVREALEAAEETKKVVEAILPPMTNEDITTEV